MNKKVSVAEAAEALRSHLESKHSNYTPEDDDCWGRQFEPLTRTLLAALDAQPAPVVPEYDREYFAAKALAGLLANPSGPVQSNPSSGWGLCNCTPENVAGLSYEMADAMLAAQKDS